MVRENAIKEQRIDDYQSGREGAGYTEGVGDRDSLVDGVRILEGGVGEGEVLVVGLDGVKDPKTDYTGTGFRVSGATRWIPGNENSH